MKVQWYKRLICYVFIAILFASGMQVNIDHSHSYFACKSQSTSETPLYTATETFLSTDYCTTEALQGRTTQFIRNNTSRSHTNRRIQSFSPINACNQKKILFYFFNQQKIDFLCSTSCQTFIIQYIHRQDGAK